MRTSNALYPDSSDRIARTIAATLVLLATCVIAALLLRGHVPTRLDIWLATAVTAAATLVTASIFFPLTRYPRSSYIASAATMTVAILLTPLHGNDPVQWGRMAREFMWMFPWYFLTLQIASPARSGGVCRAEAGHLLLPAASALFGAILHVAFLFGAR